MPKYGIRICKLQRLGSAHGITIPAEFLRAIGAVRGHLMRLDFQEDYIIVRREDETPIKLKHAPPRLGPGRALYKR
jgi:antitoxin component of MazEF toxin-antitoxin module